MDRTIAATESSTKGVSRLAPSPTGALHLGNARTFLINWALARQMGWLLIMRIEDLDGPRVKPEATAQTLEVLAWLGLDHDGPVRAQSDDLSPYRAAMRRLDHAGSEIRPRRGHGISRVPLVHVRLTRCAVNRTEKATAHHSDIRPAPGLRADQREALGADVSRRQPHQIAIH